MEQKRQEEEQNQQEADEDDDMQKKIKEQREMLRKALEEQKKKSQNNNSAEQTTINQKTAVTSGNCPPELLKEYNAALAKKVNFVDASFPPKLSTIGPNDKLDADMKSSLWLRPGQIFNSDYELFDGI